MNIHKIKRVIITATASLAIFIYNYSLCNCCFLATYEKQLPKELEETLK